MSTGESNSKPEGGDTTTPTSQGESEISTDKLPTTEGVEWDSPLIAPQGVWCAAADMEYFRYCKAPYLRDQEWMDETRDRNFKLLEATIQEKIDAGEIGIAEYLRELYIELAANPDKGVAEITRRGFRGVVKRSRINGTRNLLC